MMDKFIIAEYVASNICHDLTNYLSILKFSEEDIMNSDTPSTEVVVFLNKNLNFFILLVSFFRSLYSSHNFKSDILKVVLDMYEEKNIKIHDFNTNLMYTLSNPKLEKIISALFFIILKIYSNKNCQISFEMSGMNNIIIHVKRDSLEFERDIMKYIVADSCENAFNIMAHYISSLSTSIGYVIKVDNKIAGDLRIIVCKE